MKKLKRIGQISLAAILIGTAGTIIVAAITAWATSNSKITEVRLRAERTEITEQLHYKELVKKFDDIDKRFDKLEDLIKNK